MARRSIDNVIDDNELTFRYANETAKDIADDIGFSESTVRRHLKKLGVNKEYAITYYKDYISTQQGSDTLFGGLSDEGKERAKREMIDAFYSWAIEAKVRGEYTVIRKVLQKLEEEEVSTEDDGTYQLSTNDYAIDNTHKKTLVKIRLPPGQRGIEIYFRENKYV